MSVHCELVLGKIERRRQASSSALALVLFPSLSPGREVLLTTSVSSWTCFVSSSWCDRSDQWKEERRRRVSSSFSSLSLPPPFALVQSTAHHLLLKLLLHSQLSYPDPKFDPTRQLRSSLFRFSLVPRLLVFLLPSSVLFQSHSHSLMGFSDATLNIVE